MHSLFLYQLLASFIIGGFLVALQTLIAEKASKKIAGLVLGLPTTAAISFFFLGWTISAETAAMIIPTAIIPLAVALCFVAVYVYIANSQWNRSMPKVGAMLVTLGLSYILWAVLALPSPFLELTNMWIALLIYACLMFFPVYFLSIRPKPIDTQEQLHYTAGQKIMRAVFAGIIIMVAVAGGTFLGPFWGALFALFPAAFTSMLLIIHWYHSPVFLFKMTRTLPVGSTSMLVFLLLIYAIFPHVGFVWGTLLSYTITLMYSAILTFLPTDYSPKTQATPGNPEVDAM